MAEPRWEDWEIRYTTGNPFWYLGGGKMEREATRGDLPYYLSEPSRD